MSLHSQTTVVILLDAFRWDYLNEEDTPTLWSMAQNGIHVQKLTPSFGFCERSEIFTGTRPDVNGNFTAITYDPQSAPLANAKWLFRLFSPLDNLCNGRYIRRGIHEYFKMRGKNFPLYRIPFGLLPSCSLTEDSRDHSRAGGFSVESIFDVLLRERKRFYHGSFTALGLRNGNDDARCRDVIRHAAEGRDLYLLYIGATDSVVHHFGTQSVERHRVCRQVDQQIRAIRQQFGRHYERVNFLIFGDHGMTDVKYQVNVWREIKKVEQMHRLVNGRDYVMFLDSTMARFWFLKPESRQPIEEIFQRSPFVEQGQILTPETGRGYCVPAPSQKYGELIWWANPGTLIFPDYFHGSKPMKAMHGYKPMDSFSKGMAIVDGNDAAKSSIPQANLIDVCPTICDLIESHYPACNAGVSLLGNLEE